MKNLHESVFVFIGEYDPWSKNVPILHSHSFLSVEVWIGSGMIILDSDLERFSRGSWSDLFKKVPTAPSGSQFTYLLLAIYKENLCAIITQGELKPVFVLFLLKYTVDTVWFMIWINWGRNKQTTCLGELAGWGAYEGVWRAVHQVLWRPSRAGRCSHLGEAGLLHCRGRHQGTQAGGSGIYFEPNATSQN